MSGRTGVEAVSPPLRRWAPVRVAGRTGLVTHYGPLRRAGSAYYVARVMFEDGTVLHAYRHELEVLRG